MAEHTLKTAPDMWDAVCNGDKTAEFRKDDRGFSVGDVLVLECNGSYSLDVTTRITKVITHIVRGPDYGIPEGYVMLSLSRRFSL